MKQGEIWYADLNPTKGSVQSGFRPMVIISGDLLNQYLKVVIACPLTSKVKGYKGNLVLEPNKSNNLSERSEVLTFHIRSVPKERLMRRIGILSFSEIQAIKKGLNEILTY